MTGYPVHVDRLRRRRIAEDEIACEACAGRIGRHAQRHFDLCAAGIYK